MIRSLVIAGALVAVANSMQCLSCDNFLSCDRPIPVSCGLHQQCYTLSEKGRVSQKGCAHSCDALRFHQDSHCQICDYENFCNGEQVGIGRGVVMDEQPPQIGGGVAPNGGYHIGHGVSPRSSSQATFGALFAIPVLRRFVL